jgi:hypothetical protein
MESITLPEYITPDSSDLDEDHVRAALDFLIAVEPVPPPESREEYEKLTAPYRQQIAAAMATLRNFAKQTRPMTLERMQADYYGFTNDPRYLVAAAVAAVVQGALNEAWNGIGPWRR